MRNRLLEIFFWLFLISLTLGVSINTPTLVVIKSSLLHLGALLLALVWLYSAFSSANLRIITTPLFYLFISWLIVMGISASFAEFTWPAVDYLLNYASYATVCFISIQLFRDEIRLRRGMLILILLLAVTSLHALAQYTGFSPFYWEFRPIPRPYATFGNAVHFSGFLVLILPLALSSTLNRKTWLVRSIYGLITLIAVAALILTHTRAAWLVSGAGFILVLTYFYRANWKKAIIANMGIILIFMSSVLLMPSVRLRFFQLFNPASRTYSERVHIWEAARNMFDINRFVGYGPGSFPIYFHRFRDPFYRLHEFSDLTAHVHNDYLEFLIELGPVGLLIFLIMIGLIFKSGLKGESNRPLSIAILGGLGGSLILSLINVAGHNTAVAVLFWMMSGMVINLNQPRSTDLKIPSTFRWIGWLFFFGGVGGLFYLSNYEYQTFQSQRMAKRGDLALVKNEFRAANHFYQRALERQPANPQFWAQAGFIQLKQQDYPSALKSFEELKTLSPWYPDGDFYRGECYRLLSDSLSALTAYKSSLARIEDGKHHFRYGSLLIGRGDTAASRYHLKKAIDYFEIELQQRHNPNKDLIRRDIITAYQQLWSTTVLPRDADEMIAYLISKTHKPGENPALPHFYLAQIYQIQHDWNKALQHFEIVLQFEPNNVSVLVQTAHIYNILKQNPEKTVTYLHRVTELTPDQRVRILPDLISAYIVLKDADHVEKLLKEFNNQARAGSDSTRMLNALLLDYAWSYSSQLQSRMQRNINELRSYTSVDSTWPDKIKQIETDLDSINLD